MWKQPTSCPIASSSYTTTCRARCSRVSCRQKAGSVRRRRSTWRLRYVRQLGPCTPRASSTATSRRPTSSWPQTERTSSTWASLAHATPRPRATPLRSVPGDMPRPSSTVSPKPTRAPTSTPSAACWASCCAACIPASRPTTRRSPAQTASRPPREPPSRKPAPSSPAHATSRPPIWLAHLTARSRRGGIRTPGTKACATRATRPAPVRTKQATWPVSSCPQSRNRKTGPPSPTNPLARSTGASRSW